MEDQLSTEHVELCLDPKDGGVEGVKGSLTSGKGFPCWHKNVSVKTASAASKVLPSPQHELDTQAPKYLLNE